MSLRIRGFTLVEVMIVMVIMVILLGLGIVSMGTVQAQARDKERDGDVAALARGLELRYNQGNSNKSATYDTAGEYPDDKEVYWAMGEAPSSGTNTCTGFFTPCPQTNTSYKTQWLPGTSLANFYPPNNSTQLATGPRLVSPASSATSKTTLVYQGYYYYEAFDSSNNACYFTNTSTGPPCIRFTITYCRETAGCSATDISNATIIKSEHQ